MDFLIGVIVGAMIGAFVVGMAAVGGFSKDCETMHATRIGNTVYTCVKQ